MFSMTEKGRLFGSYQPELKAARSENGASRFEEPLRAKGAKNGWYVPHGPRKNSHNSAASGKKEDHCTVRLLSSLATRSSFKAPLFPYTPQPTPTLAVSASTKPPTSGSPQDSNPKVADRILELYGFSLGFPGLRQ